MSAVVGLRRCFRADTIQAGSGMRGCIASRASSGCNGQDRVACQAAAHAIPALSWEQAEWLATACQDAATASEGSGSSGCTGQATGSTCGQATGCTGQATGCTAPAPVAFAACRGRGSGKVGCCCAFCAEPSRRRPLQGAPAPSSHSGCHRPYGNPAWKHGWCSHAASSSGAGSSSSHRERRERGAGHAG